MFPYENFKSFGVFYFLLFLYNTPLRNTKGACIMTQTFSTASLLHGGDYNPEQWLNQPEILEKDMEYFKKAKINTVTLGVFSWAVLEP